MRKLVLAFTLILAGCSSDASLKFQQGLALVRSNVAAVNLTIASVSAELASDCGEIQNIAEALEQLAGSNQKAKAAFATANASIVSWCQKPPTDIASAVRATAKAVADARSAYEAANRGGGA